MRGKRLGIEVRDKGNGKDNDNNNDDNGNNGDGKKRSNNIWLKIKR